MNKSKIENYFSGKTTKKEELELLQYFSSENIDPELVPYKKYFQGLAELKNYSKLIIPEEDYENFTTSSGNFIYYIKRFGVAFAVAASIALFIIFSPVLFKKNDFVVINGKKYTDEKHIEMVLHASLENVKFDMKQVFDEFDNDLFN